LAGLAAGRPARDFDLAMGTLLCGSLSGWLGGSQESPPKSPNLEVVDRHAAALGSVAIGPLAAIFRATFRAPAAAAGAGGLAAAAGDSCMLITPAFAQGGALGGDNLLVSLLPFILIFVIMYFLILRPQQKRVKQHAEMVKNVRRGDTVVTSGGLVGKVTKVIDDDQIEVEVASDVRVRQMRSMIADVRAKGEPVKEESSGS
jgi:preprotein translocase subunit YajC